MKLIEINEVQIKPKDFSDRRYFPGTPGHPYHTIDKIQDFLSKIPFPIFALLLGGVVYLIFGNVSKSILIAVFFLLDWLLLRMLPVLQISYGPPLLTALALGLMRSIFLFLAFPIALAFEVFGALLVIYGFYIEPQFPHVSHHTVKVTRQNDKDVTIRIVHLSDLHMEFFSRREERAIKLINALKPDIIFFSGDFFNLSYQDHPKSHADIQKFFNSLDSKHGIYAVTGSPSVDLESSLAKVLPGLNFTLLRDQIVDLEVKGHPIELIGLECSHQPEKDYQRLEKIIENKEFDDEVARILIYHSPDIAPHLRSLPVDLQVSGHTHGGQVQIPLIGPMYTGSLYGYAFSSGHYLINNTHHLIISRGLGLEGEAAPRVRFFCPPEINEIHLKIAGHHVQLD